MRTGKWMSLLIDFPAFLLLGVSGLLWLRGAANAGSTGAMKYSQGILGVYLLIFATLGCLVTFFYSAFVQRQCGGAYSFLGKGFGYIFLGSVSLRDSEWEAMASGGTLIVLGILCVLLHFVSPTGSPIPLLFFGSGERLPVVSTHTHPPFDTTTTSTSSAPGGGGGRTTSTTTNQTSPVAMFMGSSSDSTSMASDVNPWKPSSGMSGGAATTTTTTGGRTGRGGRDGTTILPSNRGNSRNSGEETTSPTFHADRVI